MLSISSHSGTLEAHYLRSLPRSSRASRARRRPAFSRSMISGDVAGKNTECQKEPWRSPKGRWVRNVVLRFHERADR
jgi:hypothetical protein